MDNYKGIRKHHRPLTSDSRRETIKWWSELLSGERYPVYCIFLTTPLEIETAHLYGEKRKIFADAVDAMSGPFIAVLMLNEDDTDVDAHDYVATTNPIYTYRFADAFGISYDEFPALMFFTDIHSAAYVVISIKGIHPDKLLNELQNIFATINKAAKEGDDVLEIAHKYKQARLFRKLQSAALTGLEVSGKATIEAVLKAIITTLSTS